MENETDLQDDLQPDVETDDTNNSEEVVITPDPELEKKNKQLFERAKKAEEELKRLKAESPKQNTENSTESLSEEDIFLLKDLDYEDWTNLKAVQKGLGVASKKEALDSPLFKAYQKEKKDKIRKEKASLGASNGSGSSDSIELKPDMSEEEHRKIFEKYNKKN